MKFKKLDLYLIFVWLFALAYTVADIVCYYRTGTGFDATLTACVFGGTIAESGAAARLKAVEDRLTSRSEFLEDRDHEEKLKKEHKNGLE